MTFNSNKAVTAAIANGIKLFPNKVAAVDGRESITFSDLASRVGVAQNRLRDLGFCVDDKIILRSNGGINFLVASLAMMMSGIVPVLANPKVTNSEIGDVALESGARSLICSTGRAANSEGAVLEGVDQVFNLQAIVGGIDPQAKTPFSVVDPRSDRVLLALLSGGTTATPKVVPRTESQLARQVEAMVARVGWRPSDVNVCACPAAHLISLGAPGIIGALTVGATTVFVDDRAADEALEAVAEWGGSFVTLVPTLAMHWVEVASSRPDLDLSALRTVLVGGAAVTHAVVKAVTTHLADLCVAGYGMSEGFICTTLPGWSNDEIASSAGLPIDEQDSVQIVDNEIWVAGPYLTDRYWTRDASRNDVFDDSGFFRTGDEGWLDDQGRLVAVGRRANTIIRDGVKHNIEDLEREFSKIDWIDNVVVSSFDRPTGDQSVVALVKGQAPAGGVTLARAFRTALRANGTAMQKYPDHVMSVGSIPLTTVGKIDREAVRKIITEEIQ